MQDLLQNIQGLYNANEEDSGEDMRCKLDVLKTKYTTLAEMCDFPIPKNVGPTSQWLNDGSAVSENGSLKDTTDDDKEDNEVSGDDDEWRMKRIMQPILAALVEMPVARERRGLG